MNDLDYQFANSRMLNFKMNVNALISERSANKTMQEMFFEDIKEAENRLAEYDADIWEMWANEKEFKGSDLFRQYQFFCRDEIWKIAQIETELWEHQADVEELERRIDEQLQDYEDFKNYILGWCRYLDALFKKVK